MDDEGCGVEPPSWLLGKWEHVNDSLETTTFEEYNIVNRQRTSNGTSAADLCKDLIIGLTKGEVKELDKTDELYSYEIQFDSLPTEWFTYFKISDDTIGHCRDMYPCNSFVKLYR